MITVNVTQQDISDGVANDCHRCAVALATSRDMDTDCRVICDDGPFRIYVDSRSILAPKEVADFVMVFDGIAEGELSPFSFQLPPLSDPEWKEECWKCGCDFEQIELDDEGTCPECRAFQKGGTP